MISENVGWNEGWCFWNGWAFFPPLDKMHLSPPRMYHVNAVPPAIRENGTHMVCEGVGWTSMIRKCEFRVDCGKTVKVRVK